uniref:Uncharacterized protein n=2 Tax=Nothobranchius rachovii TaxID=451742 RepID=A0A1A8R9E6_9TELE
MTSVYRPPKRLSTHHPNVCLQTTRTFVHRPPGHLSTDHLDICPQTTRTSVYRPPECLSKNHLDFCPQTARTPSPFRHSNSSQTSSACLDVPISACWFFF